jgi:hypothetical protein
MALGIGLSLLLCAVVLGLRFAADAARGPKRPSNKQRWRLAQHLALGLMVLLAVYFRLQSVDRSLDGKRNHQPSWVEQIVLAVAK